MECLSPIWLKETSDRVGQYVPCSRCYNCISTKRNIWTFRMMQENKESENGYFITLTYDEENVPIIDQWSRDIPSLYRHDLTSFLKRLRESIAREEKKDHGFYKASKNGTLRPKMRYFACGEYGKDKRPHYHAIIWNLPFKYVNWSPISNKWYSDMLEDIWNKGIIDVGEVTQQSCHYVAKYTLDPLISEYHFTDMREKPFATMSRNPGIGTNYVNSDIKNHFRGGNIATAITEGNFKQPLGRFYKERIYEDDPEGFKNQKFKAIDFSEKQLQRKKKIITGGKSTTEAIENWENFKRIERKEKTKLVRKITKNNKL